MKFTKIFTVVYLVLIATVTFAQEMTEDEWQGEMNRLTEKKVSLTKELTDLQNDVNKTKAELDALASYDDCMSELYALVGGTKADIDAFRKKVNALEAKIDRKEGPKADRQAELDALKANKLSALPEFYNKVHNELQRKLDAWVDVQAEIVKQDIDYEVVKGDHLWGIAKKDQHFGNAFAWPMIYKANRDKIKNPDLIYPKQVFRIPNLTEEEKAKYDKIRRNYKPAPAPAQ
ncbi:MAG: LysM peptidoglycan-binding domain-containing protein [Ignavibacteriales bacterium]|nr:LysM peptidoglycan-binding domain-containing protein [Ignavibacteriales bacterium]MCF8316091.1 LysM peptidoglycan-binding domain-containing protein [Ignavibacteriales bacterium]MCF8436593.1 LysM peptidoglycan-binding domain-containing protein [Ignavibacteriales bacterium]